MPPIDLNTEAIVILASTFLLAGVVKGVAGVGLPAISVGLLTVAFGLMPAMALIVLPSLAGNLWQAFAGRELRTVVARIWPFELAVIVGVPIGGFALVRVDVGLLSALLGFLLIAHALNGLFRPPAMLPARHEGWAGPLAGLLTGILAAMTGSYSVPAIFYFQSLGFSRDQLIQVLGFHFSVCAALLGLTLGAFALMPASLVLISTACVIPALIGMAIGGQMRRRLSEAAFRTLFNVALLCLGMFLAARWIAG